MKFVVAQIGARRGYAVPSILARSGLLERFYTDCCADVGFGKALLKARFLPWAGHKLDRLQGRVLPQEIRDRTFTFGVPVLERALRTGLAGSDLERRFRAHLRASRALGSAMVRAGFGGATHLYSMLGECAPLLIEAKARGLKVVTEIYILLSAERIICEERQRFPGWEPAGPDYQALREEIPGQDVLLSHSDLAICPSETVREDLVRNFRFTGQDTAVVPYGVHSDWLKVDPRPQRGRVLFVGTAELRKGIQYLAAAAKTLQERGRRYEFRVAGNVRPAIRHRPECVPLIFLGRLWGDEIRREFQQADVFVLPSLAEGSAEATYQAMAAQLPIITTRAAGAVARDGIEGYILPERDPKGLADALEQVIENRALRAQMAAAAGVRAREYTWEKYSERLSAALTRVSRPYAPGAITR